MARDRKSALDLRASNEGSILVQAQMRLSELLTGTGALAQDVTFASEKFARVNISSLAYDSRQVQPGALFFALPGEKTDGNLFAAEALKRGAAAVVSEQPQPEESARQAVWIQVPQARRALALAAANFYGRPAAALHLTGITGTNGKTTTAYLIDSILRAAGKMSGLSGTIVYRTPHGTRTATNTTPESLDLQRFLAEVRDAGGTHAVLEVSSHALAMERVWGCQFDVAVFTNLTRDHLDYHKTLGDYYEAKRKLFESTGSGAPTVGVVNVDDAYGQKLVGLAGRTISYGLAGSAQVTAKKIDLLRVSGDRKRPAGLALTVENPAGEIEIRSALVGRVNVYNILAAVAAALGLGITRDAIREGVEQLANVPGRFERIEEGQPFLVVVDYAHTDDALHNLLQIAREVNPSGRILTVFGAGGDRDRSKRPLMGEAVGRGSDFIVLTADNPRSEDPLRIINDVVVGLQKAQAEYRIEPDRGRAIQLALEEARPDDIVLLAGKGHETYQVLRDRTIDFDDREMARRELRRLGYGK